MFHLRAFGALLGRDPSKLVHAEKERGRAQEARCSLAWQRQSGRKTFSRSQSLNDNIHSVNWIKYGTLRIAIADKSRHVPLVTHPTRATSWMANGMCTMSSRNGSVNHLVITCILHILLLATHINGKWQKRVYFFFLGVTEFRFFSGSNFAKHVCANALIIVNLICSVCLSCVGNIALSDSIEIEIGVHASHAHTHTHKYTNHKEEIESDYNAFSRVINTAHLSWWQQHQTKT